MIGQRVATLPPAQELVQVAVFQSIWENEIAPELTSSLEKLLNRRRLLSAPNRTIGTIPLDRVANPCFENVTFVSCRRLVMRNTMLAFMAVSAATGTQPCLFLKPFAG
jgi:hypothetical protein